MRTLEWVEGNDHFIKTACGRFSISRAQHIGSGDRSSYVYLLHEILRKPVGKEPGVSRVVGLRAFTVRELKERAENLLSIGNG